MPNHYSVAVIPGDGIGVDVINGTVHVDVGTRKARRQQCGAHPRGTGPQLVHERVPGGEDGVARGKGLEVGRPFHAAVRRIDNHTNGRGRGVTNDVGRVWKRVRLLRVVCLSREHS